MATTTGTANVAPVNLGTTVAYANTGSTSSYIAGPMTANCTLSCTVANSYLPSGVSDTTIAVTVVPQLTGTYDTTVLGLNPVGYWPLNETSGTVATNYSTNGPALNGVYSAVAACPLLQGVAGPGVLAAEANNYGTQFSTQGTQDTADSRTGVVINDPALMNITGSVSVAMWVRLPMANGTFGIQEVYGQADNTLIRYSVFGTGDAQMDFVDGGDDVTGGPALNDGLWHLWVATYNAANSNVVTSILTACTSALAPRAATALPRKSPASARRRMTRAGISSAALPGGEFRGRRSRRPRFRLSGTPVTAASSPNRRPPSIMPPARR